MFEAIGLEWMYCACERDMDLGDQEQNAMDWIMYSFILCFYVNNFSLRSYVVSEYRERKQGKGNGGDGREAALIFQIIIWYSWLCSEVRIGEGREDFHFLLYIIL